MAFILLVVSSLGFASPQDRVQPIRDGAIDGFAISGNHARHFDLQPPVFTGLTGP